MLPTLHSQLWGNSPTGEGRGQSNSGWGLSKTPQSCLPPVQTLTQPRQGQPCQPQAGTNYPANSNLQLHLIFI